MFVCLFLHGVNLSLQLKRCNFDTNVSPELISTSFSLRNPNGKDKPCDCSAWSCKHSRWNRSEGAHTPPGLLRHIEIVFYFPPDWHWVMSTQYRKRQGDNEIKFEEQHQGRNSTEQAAGLQEKWRNKNQYFQVVIPCLPHCLQVCLLQHEYAFRCGNGHS